MQRRAQLVAKLIRRGIPTIMKVEALNHFKRSFINEGFTDNSLVKWEKRSITDKKGKTNIYYKTNRRGKAGTLNRKGRNMFGRPILTGHNSGGNKLRNSLKARIENGSVIIYTYKRYAKRHNEGEKGMPERKFMGHSKQLDKIIEKRITSELNKIFQ